jgi:hypothetical protein
MLRSAAVLLLLLLLPLLVVLELMLLLPGLKLRIDAAMLGLQASNATRA